MSADTDKLIAQVVARLREKRVICDEIGVTEYGSIAVPFTPPEINAVLALVSALEQAREESREADAVIAQKEWEREEQVGRAEAAEADLARAREAIVQARRDLWWFIERATAEDEWGFADTDVTEIAARAMAIQDDVLGAALTAGCGDGG